MRADGEGLTLWALEQIMKHFSCLTIILIILETSPVFRLRQVL